MKICQDKVIPSTYSDVKLLHDTTICKYKFLQLILLQVHPQLSLKGITVHGIPKYITYGNLFIYTNGIVTFTQSHKLQRCQYSQRDITTMYLSHLDDPHFATAVTHCENTIMNLYVTPDEYLVPALASTITKLAPKHKYDTLSEIPKINTVHLVLDASTYDAMGSGPMFDSHVSFSNDD